MSTYDEATNLTEIQNLISSGCNGIILTADMGTAAILEECASAGVYVAGLDDFFDAVADGTDITHSKPDPEVFLVAAKKLGVDPVGCAVVEDAKAGIVAAKSGGMTALALYGDAKGCGQEDYDLTSFSDLLNIL